MPGWAWALILVPTGLIVLTCASCGGFVAFQRVRKANEEAQERALSDSAVLTSKGPWRTEFRDFIVGGYTLAFSPDGTYTLNASGINSADYRGTWSYQNGTLVLSGRQVWDDAAKKNVDGAVTYRLEWGDDRKQFTLFIVSVSALGKETKNRPFDDLDQSKFHKNSLGSPK